MRKLRKYGIVVFVLLQTSISIEKIEFVNNVIINL